MLQDSNQLVQLGISKSATGQCACGGNRITYNLPKRLQTDVLPYLEKFGIPAFDFSTTCLLKIETPEYIISGVKKLKEIRFVLKKKDAKIVQEQFENMLIKYIEETKGT